MKNVLIWGACGRTKDYVTKGYFKKFNIIAIVDTYYNGESYLDYKVINPNEINHYNDEAEYLIICSGFYEDIIAQQLVDLNFSSKKIIIASKMCLSEPYKTYSERVKEVIPEIYEEIKPYGLCTVQTNTCDATDETIFRSDMFDTDLYINDYFRYRTFEFISDIVRLSSFQM